LNPNSDSILLPVVPDPQDFDLQSGSWLERIIFNNRLLVIVFCTLMTAFLGFKATQLKVNANFESMVPTNHPYIANYLQNKSSLGSLGNTLRVVVQAKEGDIFDKDYLEVVRQVNDKLYLREGVDRSWMKSVWTPATSWTEITEEGFRAGPVMPFDYNASPQSVETFKLNVLKSGIVGNLVGSDFKSSAVVVPLLDKIAETGQPIDYGKFSAWLESDVRSLETERYKIHIVGFSKLAGDLISSLYEVMAFFGISALIAALVIFLYTRDIRSTLLLVLTATLGVVWLLGLLQILGYDLNPFSILVPFLIFAIGLSHGAQKMNGIMQDIGRGTHKYVAARYTFRRLFMAGLTALLTNVVGFAVLMIIDIPAIRDLALTTSVGVSILIFTKLCFIPVALSYIGVSPAAAARSVKEDTEIRSHHGMGVVWGWLEKCCEPRIARPLVLVSLVIGVAAATLSLTSLKIGDLDPGAPELRAESRYNRDLAYINENYASSGDPFAVILKTAPDAIRNFETQVELDRLTWELQQLPEVIGVNSLSNSARFVASGTYEGHPKWSTVLRNAQASSTVTKSVASNSPEMMDQDGSVSPVIAYLRDHKADTLTNVVRTVEEFAQEHNTPDRQFLLAAGSAGFEAATNIVVKEANYRMLGLLYAAVVVLCFITFRSWRAVVVAMVPLLITSFLCEALMVVMGIGVKVATLPVIALGVGVGVDYALYLLSVQLTAMRRGASLKQAYSEALNFTGKVVALIGITMAAGVITWAWSPIKFQADMGILLTFMFVWNMLGALTLIPALSYFLLKPSPLKTTQFST